MKIKRVTILNNGASESLANEVFDKIAKFADYGFNKSHAVEYALISYQSMWVKVNAPAQFWAGVLSMVKEERHTACIADMTRMGISLQPPDVNLSGVHFTALNDAIVLAPLTACKGVSDRVAEAVVEARVAGGPFASMADFEARVAGRACNIRQREILDRVGAFSRIEPGQKPADHPDRRRDQVELLPGLIREAVIVDRPMELGAAALAELNDLVNAYRGCTACELSGLCHPRPMLRGEARAMIVVDGPNYRDEAADELGASSEALEEALGRAGLALSDIYLTALVKSPKPERSKVWSKETLGACPDWLDREIAILRPPVIALMGPNAVRRFLPGLKGGIAEHTGRVIYDKARDCNILIGMNPAAIYFDPAKQSVLDDVAARLAELLPA